MLIFNLFSRLEAVLKFARKGDVSSVNLLGQPMVILNSAKAAVDLLERRSEIYSDRPSLVMAGEL